MNERIKISYRSMVAPAGTVVSAIRVSVMHADMAGPISQDVAPGTTDVVFQDLPAGDYTVTALALDGSALPIAGSDANGTFSMVNPVPTTVTILVPGGLTASQE